ncbi:four-helix bundle copper-binding protein [Nonomuraea terrae]|uniref:Four-helix bundle copper-binding protein n=2 Tax=Nonomuraea terrae TaxID=2530383 RepID=A0A4R4Z9M5_9ACTN|nr:four-helix bundle copper-binding protein [Nonomuraea terrae]
MRTEGQMSPEMQRCVDACMESHSSCEQTMSYCLKKGGRFVDMAMMGALMDCSDITRLCADMMMRQSPMAMDMARMCAQVATKCAEACMTMTDDATMKRCAEKCKACAEACKAMAAMPA